MEFYLAWYFNMDCKGNYTILSHKVFMDKAKYFKGVADGVFKQDIDSLLFHINNSKPIIIPDTPYLVYSGFNYCLDYKIGEKDSGRILYINSPERCPENILTLTRKLDALILNTNMKQNRIDSFSLGAYIDTLKKNMLFLQSIDTK